MIKLSHHINVHAILLCFHEAWINIYFTYYFQMWGVYILVLYEGLTSSCFSRSSKSSTLRKAPRSSLVSSGIGNWRKKRLSSAAASFTWSLDQLKRPSGKFWSMSSTSAYGERIRTFHSIVVNVLVHTRVHILFTYN